MGGCNTCASQVISVRAPLSRCPSPPAGKMALLLPCYPAPLESRCQTHASATTSQRLPSANLSSRRSRQQLRCQATTTAIADFSKVRPVRLLTPCPATVSLESERQLLLGALSSCQPSGLDRGTDPILVGGAYWSGAAQLGHVFSSLNLWHRQGLLDGSNTAAMAAFLALLAAKVCQQAAAGATCTAPL